MAASLEAQYLQRQQDFSRQQRIKTVDGIQANDAAAAYLDKFREKLNSMVTAIIRSRLRLSA